MFGRFKGGGIPALSSYAEAMAHWENVKPIRGRRDDERPLGERRKSEMQIARNLDTVICVLYHTNVITFHPDDTITVNVPEEWRTHTTAEFIYAVLRRNIQYVGIKDGDVVMMLKGPTYGTFRVGTQTRFKLHSNGLELLGGNIVRDTHAVNRKVMNAARAKVSKFRKYLAGVLKLRDGMFDSNEAVELDAFFARHGMGYVASADLDEWRGKLQWSLELPKNMWCFRDVNRKVWLEQAEKFVEIAEKCDDEDVYGLTLWLVLSGINFGNRTSIRATEEALNFKITDLLIMTHPDVLEGTPEPQNEIKVNRYKHYVNLLNALKGGE